MNLTIKNILANYGNRIVGLLSLYLFTPFYIRLVGIEAYGVISFFTLVYGVITFADAGITSAMDREFAKSYPDSYKLSLLKVFEKIYLAICLTICLTLVVFAKPIAAGWLNSDTIPQEQLVLYTRLIGLSASLQLMPMVYIGAMMGLQKQVRVSVIQSFWSLSKALGAILLLSTVKADLLIFFSWQIFCNLIFVFIARQGLMSALTVGADSQTLKFSNVPRHIWQYIGGMFFLSTLTAISVQLDKIVTSKLFTLEKFGYYSLLSLFTQIPLLIATPVVLAFFPAMNRHISEGRKEKLYEPFKRFSTLISCLIFPACSLLIISGLDLFKLIFRKSDFNSEIEIMMQYAMIQISIASVFLALQQIMFYFLLANGKTRYSIAQGIAHIILMVPALYFSIQKYDLMGVGIPLLVLNAAGFLYLLMILKNSFLKGRTQVYLIDAIAKPLLATCIVTVSIFALFTVFNLSTNTIILGFTAATASFLCCLITSDTRKFRMKTLI